MDNKLKAVNKVLSVTVVILAFVMLFTTPVMLDDWWFGANTKDMLKFVFTAYDGRYIPNVLVVVLLWAPVIVRAAVELIILIGLAYFIFRTLKGSGYLLSLFAVLFLFVPGSIFVQTFTWVTGYTLYIVSALTVMFLYDLFINQVLEDKPISVKKMCILCPLVLLSQLVLETTTLYAFFLMIATLVIYYVRYKKISRQTLIFLLFAAAGAVLMFHNGAYSSAVGERNIAEKTIYLGPSMTENIRIWWIIFKSIVAVLWFGSSSLSALAAIILVPYS